MFPLEYGLVFVQSPFKCPRCEGVLLAHSGSKNKTNCVLQPSLPCLLPCPFAPSCRANPRMSISLSGRSLAAGPPFRQARGMAEPVRLSPANFQVPWKWEQSTVAILLNLGLLRSSRTFILLTWPNFFSPSFWDTYLQCFLFCSEL